MDFFLQPKDASALNREIENLQKYLTGLLTEKEVLEEDLAGYDVPGYDQFKKVLAKEKIRIALKRMTVVVTEEWRHEQLQGQFNECEKLERNRETIERELAINRLKITDSLNKVEKLKKKLSKQTKEK
jgi:hypothetical protein